MTTEVIRLPRSKREANESRWDNMKDYFKSSDN